MGCLIALAILFSYYVMENQALSLLFIFVAVIFCIVVQRKYIQNHKNTLA